MSGDGARIAYPLFQEGDGGSKPTSPLQLEIYPISFQTAQDLNKRWHSRLPKIPFNTFLHVENICFGAVFENKFYACAMWSEPIARALNGRNWLELRRMAICPDAPQNTASRMISVMTKIIKKTKPHIIKLISYQDTEVHRGTIYKASGWFIDAETKGADWNKSRKRNASQTTEDKIRWARNL